MGSGLLCWRILSAFGFPTLSSRSPVNLPRGRAALRTRPRAVPLARHPLHSSGIGWFGQQADGGGIAFERFAGERVDLRDGQRQLSVRSRAPQRDHAGGDGRWNTRKGQSYPEGAGAGGCSEERPGVPPLPSNVRYVFNDRQFRESAPTSAAQARGEGASR